jgi:hypothetical protein
VIGDVLDSNPLIVAAYAATAVACWSAGGWARRRDVDDGDHSEWARFWYVTAVALGVIGFVRLFGIADDVSRFLHHNVREEGWYTRRRKVQVPVIIAIAVVWIAAIPYAWRAVRNRSRRVQLAAVVAVSLLCFSVIRFISLHQVDHRLYREELFGAEVATWIELAMLAVLAGLACIARAPRPATTGRRSVTTSSGRRGPAA